MLDNPSAVWPSRRIAPSSHFRPLAITILTSLLSVGCGQTAVPVQSLAPAGSGGNDRPAGRTWDQWQADPARLEADLRRATEALHWAVLRLDRRPAALELDEEPPPPEISLQSAIAWRLRALLPDGREAHVVAWEAQPGQVAVSALVGHFGDAALEKRFIDELRRTLAGPAQRVRHDKFLLPD